MGLRALDLFCGAGGASEGLRRAGFEVVGVDDFSMPRYPFEFHQTSPMRFPLEGFDHVHASPPCQRWSTGTKKDGDPDSWPDFIADLRRRFEAELPAGVTWSIENVPGAPLLNPTMLCGTMFAGLRVIRHRHFETNFPLPQPEHPPHPLVYTRDKRKAHYGRLDERTAYVQVTGGGNCSVAAARDAMGIEWMNKTELNEAIPPVYAEYVGRYAREEHHALVQG